MFDKLDTRALGIFYQLWYIDLSGCSGLNLNWQLDLNDSSGRQFFWPTLKWNIWWKYIAKFFDTTFVSIASIWKSPFVRISIIYQAVSQKKNITKEFLTSMLFCKLCFLFYLCFVCCCCFLEKGLLNPLIHINISCNNSFFIEPQFCNVCFHWTC